VRSQANFTGACIPYFDTCAPYASLVSLFVQRNLAAVEVLPSDTFNLSMQVYLYIRPKNALSLRPSQLDLRPPEAAVPKCKPSSDGLVENKSEGAEAQLTPNVCFSLANFTERHGVIVYLKAVWLLQYCYVAGGIVIYLQCQLMVLLGRVIVVYVKNIIKPHFSSLSSVSSRATKKPAARAPTRTSAIPRQPYSVASLSLSTSIC
jgi:hypothetical protein